MRFLIKGGYMVTLWDSPEVIYSPYNRWERKRVLGWLTLYKRVPYYSVASGPGVCLLRVV